MKPKFYNILSLSGQNRNILRATGFIFLWCLTPSCEDFVTIDPPRTEVISETVFDNEAASISAVNGIYSMMMTNSGFANGQLERFSGLSSDELINYSTNDEELQFFTNTITPANRLLQSTFWQEAFKYIHNANAIIEGLEKSGLNTAASLQLLGEARFIRAFCHFHLVNLFGKVPYVKTTEFEVNARASRNEISSVYENIIEDLTEARLLLADDFAFAGAQRVRPNRGAATAFLARVYLYQGKWSEAEAMATELISNPSYGLSIDLDQVFLPSSTETIWQLKPVIPGDNTQQANIFVLTNPPDGFVKKVSLSKNVYDSFEAGDARQAKWAGTVSDGVTEFYYPYKYKMIRDGADNPSEFSVVLRLAEQYLIRAEARTMQNKIAEAIPDLDIIRTRAGLAPVEAIAPSPTQSALLSMIENERLSELFAEWGHRWFDLKRTGRANAVLGPLKPTWTETGVLYPVPQSEVDSNPNLLPQNDGY